MFFHNWPWLRCCRSSQIVKAHLPPARCALTQDRCQQLHLPIPLNRTVPTTINPPLHSHKNCLCLCPDHNTSSCISHYLLFLSLSCFCPLSISHCFHYRHDGLLPLTQGQSLAHIPAELFDCYSQWRLTICSNKIKNVMSSRKDPSVLWECSISHSLII